MTHPFRAFEAPTMEEFGLEKAAAMFTADVIYGPNSLEKLGLEKATAMFTSNVIFHSPILTKPLSGHVEVLPVLAMGLSLVSPLNYTAEASIEEQTILLWQGQMEGYKLQGTTILIQTPEGLIKDIAILMRPYPVVTLFQRAMRKWGASLLPDDYWELEL